MMLRWFGLFAGVVRVALILALLALVALALMIIGRAALTIRAGIESPPASAAPLPPAPAPSAPASTPTGPAPLSTPASAPTAPAPPVAPTVGAAPSGSSVVAAPTPVDAAALRATLIAAWQCDRDRRGLPPLVGDPELDMAAQALQRAVQAQGPAALRAAAARYDEVIVGALPLMLVASMSCDAPLPAGAPPTDAATRRIGLAVIVPPHGGDSPAVPVSFAFIGVREERAP